MFLKIYFLNFRYFFIAKKQQLVLYSYITYENNQPASRIFAWFLHPHPGEFANFLKEMLMLGGGGGEGGHCWNRLMHNKNGQQEVIMQKLLSQLNPLRQ